MDQTSIAEGIGNVVVANDSKASGGTTPVGNLFGLVNVRQRYIHGNSQNSVGSATAANFIIGSGFGKIPQGADAPSGVTTGSAAYTVRRYQVNFALGLFTQDKLVSYFYFFAFAYFIFSFVPHEN